mmetsp:Transcript_3254/g.5837  ORF Transcript_3254/g.5837 Transcript_3254/m.5837 type:complete len:198 (+) Transcript_3254:3-596(+)
MPFGVSDRDGVLKFYKNDNKTGGSTHEFWGFSAADHEKNPSGNPPVVARVIDFEKWFSEHIVKRRLPEGYASTKPPSVVVKMDIEGFEMRVLTRMLLTGAACHLDLVFLEYHNYGIPMNNGEVYHGDSQLELYEGIRKIMKAGGCKGNFTRWDYEGFLHDGKPLPTPGAGSSPKDWAVSSKLAVDYESPTFSSGIPE